MKVKQLLQKASKLDKSIVFPEAEISDRILKAVEIILKKKVARPILLGDEEKILAKGYKLTGATIINPKKSELLPEFAEKLYELRKAKGMTEKEAKKTVENPFYFAAMMVYCGYADSTLGGAETSTADSLRPGLQVIKAKEGIKTISSCTMFVGTDKLKFGENNVIFFADTSLNITLDENQLSDVAVSTVETAKLLADIEPRVAMLSFSTMGSGGNSDELQKIRNAVKLTQKRLKGIAEVDGEMQLDAALIESVGKLKAPKSKVAGRANILVFPDLTSANIGYKIAERFGRLQAVGQIQQGFRFPVNDLSRGCHVEDIVVMTAVTVIQTQTI